MPQVKEKRVSTTALSKQSGIPARELFSQLHSLGLIDRDGDSWVLTPKGISLGGVYIDSAQYGRYIAWPEDIDINMTVDEPLVAATLLGKAFDISAIKMNRLLSELGWIKRGMKGWLLTEQGRKQGGQQAEDPKTGVPFVRWPKTITNTKALRESIEQVNGKSTVVPANSEESKQVTGFRQHFEAEHRAADGHFVRSKAEMLIDNWLYMAEIVHAYERKLPIEEDVYCDFYIPAGKVYIEYWGYENNIKYLARKETKISIYKQYGFNLIELQDSDVKNLDDVLPRLLLKYGVQAF